MASELVQIHKVLSFNAEMVHKSTLIGVLEESLSYAAWATMHRLPDRTGKAFIAVHERNLRQIMVCKHGARPSSSVNCLFHHLQIDESLNDSERVIHLTSAVLRNYQRPITWVVNYRPSSSFCSCETVNHVTSLVHFVGLRSISLQDE